MQSTEDLQEVVDRAWVTRNNLHARYVRKVHVDKVQGQVVYDSLDVMNLLLW